jgi:hypothetical protein
LAGSKSLHRWHDRCRSTPQQEVVEKVAEHSEPTTVTAAVVAAGLFDHYKLFVDSRCLCQTVLRSLDELR